MKDGFEVLRETRLRGCQAAPPAAFSVHEIALYAMAPAAIRDTAIAAIQMNACSSRIQGCGFRLLIPPTPLQLLSSRRASGFSNLSQSLHFPLR
jgi:hypothetical protein